MAGHGYVKHDPAIERWNIMREDVYKHFRFTSRTAFISFAGLVVIPVSYFYLASSLDLRWSWAGKRKGESLNRITPEESS